MEEKDYRRLQEASNEIMRGLNEFITNHENSDEFLYKLKGYIDDARRKGCDWDIGKAQVVLAVLQSKNPSEIQGIISYMEQSNYGWQGDTYKFYSRCSDQCRRNFRIYNTPEETEQAFSDMDKIFLHKEYGVITMYLFGYCLASLFSSRLKEQSKSVPYFLQIACKRNSNVFRLVHEIVHICDVNTGLFENCEKYHYRECNHDHLTLYPSETGDKLLETLIYYRDIPIIVDGYENEKLYEILIREVANIPRKIKRLDIKAKFSILPVFISPTIRSHFQNVFSIDLTDLDIADEYIEIILKNKQRLGSWALELVANAKEHFDAWNSTSYSQQTAIAELIEKRHHEDRMPLFYDLTVEVSRLRTKYNLSTKLTSKDIDNIGYVSYFFSYFMRKVFKGSIQLSEETPFTYRGIHNKHIPAKLIEQIVEQATDSLIHLHSICSPARPESLNFDIDSSDEKEVKKIEKKGITYAKDIVKYYQSYKVNINISDIKYKDARYVFSVKLLPGTGAKLLSRYAEEVRRLLGLEVFMLDITSSEIKLVASEKLLDENSLIKILESDQFKESKMEIPYAVGYDILGEMVIADIAEFPHLLVGGTSSSGKSSALHSLLMSIVYKQPANKVKLLLLDFGSSDLKIFDKVPHMLKPTVRVDEIEKARHYLLGLQTEMNKRLKKKDELDKRKFAVEFIKWPSIICVIDEFPAFVRQLTEGKYNKKAYMIIEDILARARKVKIHLVLAAQNASKGNIEIGNTNLGASIAFRCINRYDSEAIIGCSDAVNLAGKGTMYFRCCQFEGIKRIQGAFMPIDEIIDKLDTMNFISGDEGKTYDIVEFEPLPLLNSNVRDQGIEGSAVEFPSDELLCRIIQLALNENRLSNRMIKLKFEMGYDRANIFMEQLEKAEIISKQREGTKKQRNVNHDRAKEFLRNKGYSIDLQKGERVTKAVEIPDIQKERESIQEQNVKLAIEESDVSASADVFTNTASQRQGKKMKIGIPPDTNVHLQDDHKTKRRSVH